MKFSSVLLFASSLVGALAAPAASRSRVFHLKTANSPNSDLNGALVKNIGNHASLGTGGVDVRAYFADDGSRRLIVNGLDGTEDNAYLIPTTPGSAISNFVFADAAISESRSTEWGITNGKLVYGSEDRFYAFPTTNGWEVSSSLSFHISHGPINTNNFQIRWVDAGTIITADSFTIDLAIEYLN
ncbi:unnamed protein product [Tuber aestivum]|uniref:Uncharacterized protein n=1 Tax=Tuber aestivum TaxID=59557 RepID=A0A292PZU1_9PEZI|nr:unnamed protein product [Tuber aestivum]